MFFLLIYLNPFDLMYCSIYKEEIFNELYLVSFFVTRMSLSYDKCFTIFVSLNPFVETRYLVSTL